MSLRRIPVADAARVVTAARRFREPALKKSRFTEEQIDGVLKGAKAGVPVAELCRKPRITGVTFYRWKSKYGGLEVNEARRLRQLEEENRRLKQMMAEQALDIQALEAVVGKSTEARRSARDGGRHARAVSVQRAACWLVLAPTVERSNHCCMRQGVATGWLSARDRTSRRTPHHPPAHCIVAQRTGRG